MSRNFEHLDSIEDKGIARVVQKNESVNEMLKKHFDIETLYYLEEGIIDYLLDSLALEKYNIIEQTVNRFNDYSFLTAPAYKALEGFLFQIAEDLELPSGKNLDAVGGYYFDEMKVDKHINKLLKELEKKAEETAKLSRHEKKDIKERIQQMKSFLKNYRHTPAHYLGESIGTIEKADRNIKIIFGAIDDSAKIFLKSGLINNEE